MIMKWRPTTMTTTTAAAAMKQHWFRFVWFLRPVKMIIICHLFLRNRWPSTEFSEIALILAINLCGLLSHRVYSPIYTYIYICFYCFFSSFIKWDFYLLNGLDSDALRLLWPTKLMNLTKKKRKERKKKKKKEKKTHIYKFWHANFSFFDFNYLNLWRPNVSTAICLWRICYRVCCEI